MSNNKQKFEKIYEELKGNIISDLKKLYKLTAISFALHNHERDFVDFQKIIQPMIEQREKMLTETDLMRVKYGK